VGRTVWGSIPSLVRRDDRSAQRAALRLSGGPGRVDHDPPELPKSLVEPVHPAITSPSLGRRAAPGRGPPLALAPIDDDVDPRSADLPLEEPPHRTIVPGQDYEHAPPMTVSYTTVPAFPASFSEGPRPLIPVGSPGAPIPPATAS